MKTHGFLTKKMIKQEVFFLLHIDILLSTYWFCLSYLLSELLEYDILVMIRYTSSIKILYAEDNFVYHLFLENFHCIFKLRSSAGCDVESETPLMWLIS
ncbi:hypothetical protein GQ55_8G194700 [Panicum hallii var. hallii]|uniref:Uncharacterized protein n=1 Tax=Panicum hallii var. hallii TaxID=1504633 RepID=A0A2T7CP71_9POAL|nr:hypothetical protein GQ55_8G194700 [Panicum hallii var. hallii]